MKISKLLVLGMLVVALCTSTSVFAQSSVGLSDPMGPNGNYYSLGDTVNYILGIENTGDITLVNINVYFFAPDNPPTAAICGGEVDPAAVGGVLVGQVASLAPGATDEFIVPYEITEVPCGGEPIPIIAQSGTTYFATGSDFKRCDSEAAENYVNPMEAPVCEIDGPTTAAPGDQDLVYLSVYPADTYLWTVTGDAVIDSSNIGASILVDVTGLGSFNVNLLVCNDNGADEPVDWCCETCNLPVSIVGTPGIHIEKATNDEDADDPTGPILLVGDPITWTYVVTNTGNVPLYDVVVIDDNGTPGVTPPATDDDFYPTYMSGDDGDEILQTNEIWLYEYTGIAEADQYENIVCVDALYLGEPVGACDPSHYFGADPDIDIEKATNGQDADDPTGPSITVGDPVTWTYVVCNTGNVALTGIVVIDDNGTPGDAGDDFSPTYVSGDEGEADVMEVGECWTYTAAGTAELGQYENDACVDGTWLGILPDDEIDDVIVSDCDPSHYIGVEIGNTFCSWTQGFWGNAGGTSCGGQTTTELLELAFAAAPGNVIIVGSGGNTLTFETPQDVLDGLPAGGKGKALSGDNTYSDLEPPMIHKKTGAIKNVLVGQAVALQLNLLVADNCLGEDSGDLGAWVLEADFCTVPYGDEEACAEYSMIPESLADGVNTVADLLAAVNAALGGTGEISDAYSGASAINEGFDECRTIVPCFRPEICGNECDDDGDGLIDLDDPDCQPG